MNFQIRIRTDASFPDISYITHWLDESPRGFAFEHNKPGNHHYHVYLFDLERNCDAMRKHLGKHLSDKQRYAVGITCGAKKKTKITPKGAYIYGTTDKLLSPIWSKGFSLEELQEYHEAAVKFYKPVPIIAHPDDAKNLPEVIYKVDRVWERLRDHREDYQGLTVKAIKSKLAADWLNNGRAVPRSADLHRYAISLYYLNKYKDEVVPDDALMYELS